MNDLEWLAANRWNSMSLCRNDDHACNYMRAAEWIEDQPEDFEGCDADDLLAMKVSDTIWKLQIFPQTPVGSYTFYASTMEKVIALARRQAAELDG